MCCLKACFPVSLQYFDTNSCTYISNIPIKCRSQNKRPTSSNLQFLKHLLWWLLEHWIISRQIISNTVWRIAWALDISLMTKISRLLMTWKNKQNKVDQFLTCNLQFLNINVVYLGNWDEEWFVQRHCLFAAMLGWSFVCQNAMSKQYCEKIAQVHQK